MPLLARLICIAACTLITLCVTQPAKASVPPDPVSGPRVTVAPNAVRDVFATCPAGTIAVGGGYIQHGNATQNGIVLVNGFDPNVRGRWFVRVKNDSAASLTIQAQATCGHSSWVRQQIGLVSVVAPHTTKDVFANCGQGEVRFGGGFVQPGNATQNGIVLVNGFDSNANRWFVRVKNDSSSPLSINAQVTCEKASYLLHQNDGTEETAAPYSVKDVFAYCTGLQQVYRQSGGYIQRGNATQNGIVLVSGFDSNVSNRWFVRVKNDSASPLYIRAQVSCWTDPIH